MQLSTLSGLEGSRYFSSWEVVWFTAPIYDIQCLYYDFAFAFSCFASVPKLNHLLICCLHLASNGRCQRLAGTRCRQSVFHSVSMGFEHRWLPGRFVYLLFPEYQCQHKDMVRILSERFSYYMAQLLQRVLAPQASKCRDTSMLGQSHGVWMSGQEQVERKWEDASSGREHNTAKEHKGEMLIVLRKEGWRVGREGRKVWFNLPKGKGVSRHMTKDSCLSQIC